MNYYINYLLYGMLFNTLSKSYNNIFIHNRIKLTICRIKGDAQIDYSSKFLNNLFIKKSSFPNINNNFIQNSKQLSSKEVSSKQSSSKESSSKPLIKIISISPAGYKGVYSMGVCNYIKKHYNLDNYVFSGASAGAWNALLLCYKKDSSVFKNDILHYGLNNSNNILELQLLMKKKLLENYSINDFKINKLYIGVTTLQNFHPETIIYNDFKSLEDAIDCCIASSHIPFITGEMINKYHNLYSFDGGFSKHPYLHTKANLHITPDIWSQNKVHNDSIFDISLFYKNKYNFTKLYEDGYNDSHNNKKILDSVFIKH